jgi:pilus assembly protein Flp/PilA
MRRFATRFVKNDEGAALVEYGMLVGLIAAVCIVAVTALGAGINTVFTTINTALAAIPGF